MLRLASILYAIVGTTMAGLLMIAALVTGYDTAKFILIAVALGAIIAIPVSYFIAAAIKANDHI